MRTLVQRIVGTHSRSPLNSSMPEIVSGVGARSNDVSVLDAIDDARTAHAEFLRDAAARMTASYEIDSEFIVDVVEGTLRYRSLLGGPITPELADQLTELLCGQAGPRID